MVHPSDGEVWKNLNKVHPYFSMESRNIRLGLYTNRFNLFGLFAGPYFCWPTILTTYNLPLGMCMRPKFMFLSTVIPISNSLSRNIDVCIWPLIDELKQLWSFRTLTYDVLRKQHFPMKTTLMWTINNFLSYGMVSGCSIHGKSTCPYCMENNKAFTLTNSGKAFFFCHQWFLSTDHKYRKNINDFFIDRVEKDVVLSL